LVLYRQDPLGVAVQQTFGIGLGFMFDHMSNATELSATRRLQSRAAKSAILRAKELYDSEAIRRELESISDPAERKKRADEDRRATDKEIRHMAERLSDLIPTDLSLGNDQLVAPMEMYDLNSFKRTSSHEYVMRAGSPTIQNLFRSLRNATGLSAAYTIDYLNPMGNATSDNSTADDEFIEAWTKQQQPPPPPPPGPNRSGNENDDIIETFLV